MTENDIQITGEPLPVPSMCRFVVDRPISPQQSFYFGNHELAAESPLAKRIFEIDGVTAVLVAHSQLTVTKEGPEAWPVVGKQIGAAIRAHLETGAPAIPETLRDRLPSPDVIRERVQELFDTEINPSLASHGGFVRLVDVKDNVVYLQLGGGCQGCGMATFTLKQGVEVAIRKAVPEVGDIRDTTDHAAGSDPYYAASS